MQMNKSGTNSKAIAILRVSSHRQKDGISFEVQRSEVEKYSIKNNLELIDVVAIVESAKDSDHRKKYRQALDGALKEGIYNILYYMNDRECRNLTDNERSEQLIRAGLISIHYVREGKVLDRDSADSDFFLRDIQAASNKQFIRNLTAKTVDAMKRKAESGWMPANHVPLGYIHQKVKDADGKELKRGTIIVPDPDEKNILQVKREFELRAQGFSFEAIRTTIIEEGLISERRLKTYRANTVEKRIRNEFYRGHFEWQGKRYKGNHQLIIPVEILQTIDGKKSFYGRRNNENNDARLFDPGWLTCGDASCGCQITFELRKKTLADGGISEYRLYRCSNSKKIHKSLRGMYSTEEKILRQFEGAVEAIALTDDLASKIAQAMREIKEKAHSKTKKEMEAYKIALVDLEQSEDRLYDDHIKGLIGVEMYQRRIARIREQRHEFTEMMDQARNKIEGVVYETAESLIELAKNAKSLVLSGSTNEYVKFLKTICSNQVLDGSTVRYDLKKPFAILAQMSGKENWRSQGDLNPCILREREVS